MLKKYIPSMRAYVRAANYLSAAQIYLQNNALLSRPLDVEDIKPRLLGHWGTCPGINFIYAHTQALIKDTDAEMLFLLGPGHGFPALQANLFIEGSLGTVDGKATHDAAGVDYITRNFSWPHGFPSHSNPEAPGVILEGGELGYSLATAYGAVLDNPNLIAVTVVGDGEAETGPLSAAWHAHRLIHPGKNGAVLPILHLNGYKISGPTLFGRMRDDEIVSYFKGCGYDPIIVDESEGDVYEAMAEAMASAYVRIQERKETAARIKTGGVRVKAKDKPRVLAMHLATLPEPHVIILRTPKGWTGIAEMHGNKIEGNALSHQVVAPNVGTDDAERAMLEGWLRSYGFNELFDPESGFSKEIHSLVPKKELRMGMSKYARGGSQVTKPLALPKTETVAVDVRVPGSHAASSMVLAGEYLAEVFKLNAKRNNFRLFSPDETYSNKLDAVFNETARAFALPIEGWDKDMDPEGRVMEMLSEHTLQGLIEGYVLTGRHGVFASYEAFIQIVSSMADQYAKFLKVAREVKWRGEIPSLNYILTSSGWRQDHNGFSHQNPGFITDMLQRQGDFIHAYFPPDANSTLAVLERCLSSREGINIVSAGKTMEPQWLSRELAEKELEKGLMTWDFASDRDPHVVLVSVGDYMTKEALAAITLVRAKTKKVRMRFVNIMTLSTFGFGGTSHSITQSEFDTYFTSDKPVIVNFHGYPQVMKSVFFDFIGEGGASRFRIHGYEEHGSTTTPFDMQVRNGTDRYTLAIEVFDRMALDGVISKEHARTWANEYREHLSAHRAYIRKYGVDPEEITNWTWSV